MLYRWREGVNECSVVGKTEGGMPPQNVASKGATLALLASFPGSSPPPPLFFELVNKTMKRIMGVNA